MLHDDLADLVLSRVCVRCERAGPVLCPACWDAVIDLHPLNADRTDGVRGFATTRYVDAAQRALIEFKEHGVLALARPLGAWLALAIAETGPPPVCVVPIPPHRASVTARGVDIVDLLLRHARAHLLRNRYRIRRAPALERVVDQGRLVGRGARARQAAVAHTMRACRVDVAPGERLVIVDDIVTSGATVREAVRALVATGVQVDAVAAVAATPRSRKSREPGLYTAHHGINA